MKQLTTTKDTLPQKPTRFGTDINLARPGIFVSKGVRGYRTLEPVKDVSDGLSVTRTVSIGTYRDTGKTLDMDDNLVMKVIYARWEMNGANMEDRKLVTALMNTGRNLLPVLGIKSRRLGQRDYNRIRTCIDKLSQIGITYDNAWENNLGWSTKTITILKSVKLFNRADSLAKGGKYFDFSEFELNEDICQNIKDNKIKLFYVDQYYAIRSEAGRLVYERLEFLGGVIKSPFRREALEFAKECTIDIGPNGERLKRKEILRKMQRLCKELRGKLLTSGIIGDAKIVFDRKKEKHFFECPINKVVTTRIKKTKTGVVHAVPHRRDLEHESDRLRIDEALRLYDTLSESEKQHIDRRAKEIHKEKYHGMGSGMFAKAEAVQEHVGLRTLHEDVKTIKESTPQSVCERTQPENEIRPSFGSPAYVMLEVRALQKIRENWSVK